MADELPDFYTWQIVAFGYSTHERIKRTPTRAELERATVIVVKFEGIDPHQRERHVTIRHPVGFGVVPLYSLMEDIQLAIDLAADRYNIELVETP